jgi:hypothetical protein
MMRGKANCLQARNMRTWELVIRTVRALSLVLAAMLATLTFQAAISAEFVLVNTSTETIDQLYISPCGGRHWGQNQLAGFPVGSSRSFTISKIEPGCYDIMVVLPPWNECIISGAALRRGMTWKISWSTVTLAALGECSEVAHIPSAGRRPFTANDQ